MRGKKEKPEEPGKSPSVLWDKKLPQFFTRRNLLVFLEEPAKKKNNWNYFFHFSIPLNVLSKLFQFLFSTGIIFLHSPQEFWQTFLRWIVISLRKMKGEENVLKFFQFFDEKQKKTKEKNSTRKFFERIGKRTTSSCFYLFYPFTRKKAYWMNHNISIRIGVYCY